MCFALFKVGLTFRSRTKMRGGGGTVRPFLALNPAAVASNPTIRAISWTRAFVSRGFAVLARSWESLACRHGCVETWTFRGSE